MRCLFGLSVPARSVQVEHRRGPRSLFAQLRRQRGQQLQPPCRHLGREPQVGGGPRQSGKEQCPSLTFAHPGQAGAITVD